MAFDGWDNARVAAMTPGTAPAGRCCGRDPPRLVIQEFWAWLTATQLARARAAASLDALAAAAGNAARAALHSNDALRS